MTKSKADEEDYWNSSKFKAFTFDDEDDELIRLKESRQAVNSIQRLVEEDDDEDDVEKVSWSGEPVGSISWSVKETAASNQRTDREPAFPKIPTDTPSLSKSQSGYSLSSLFKGETGGIEFFFFFFSLPFSAEDSAHVQDHYTLLERQIIIEATDRQAERGGKVEIFQKFPRRASILNMPLITTLYYCCFYHYSEPEGTYSSPLNIRQAFKISEKQYFVTALAARAKLKAWLDVDALFTSRNWLGFTRKKSPLSFQRVVDVLQKNSAPTQVLQDYVGLVEDPDMRISLAQKHKCHDIVINTYRDMKDRQQLLGYRGKVGRGSAEERKIDELLNNQVRSRRRSIFISRVM
uniref:Spermatogenesis-defective protein 39 homolog n=1 Tax=Amphiprion ocellaris TaxID=80972 RepID=A0A3Q1AGF0_AMPOC